ncbi:MAG: SRPBCC domain-containing protein [Armatimonadetes bacterium]|nr:SRPBCC domain-containing protein [Armatimonadota bacterium]
MLNEIKRSHVLPAPPEEVWRRSFGTPEALASWFSDTVEGDFAVGAPFVLAWGDHRCECLLVACEAPALLEYKWHPGDACLLCDHPEDELTIVRFSLEACDKGTLVVITETGFEKISEPWRSRVLGLNLTGWDNEPEKLVECYNSN